METSPNQVDVEILDEDNNFQKCVVSVADEDRMDEDRNCLSVQLYGITSKARARREAIFALKRAMAVTKTISFQASLEAIICEVGDLILFQHDIPQYGFGGRVTAISGGDYQIHLDREIVLENGSDYTLRVRKADGTYLVYDFTYSGSFAYQSYITVDVGDWDSDVAIDDVWVFGYQDIEAKPFRVTSISRKSDAIMSIEAEEYNASIYTDDGTIEIETIKYSQLGVVAKYEIDGSLESPPAGDPELVLDTPSMDGRWEIPPYVTDVSLTEELYDVGTILQPTIVVDWGFVTMGDNPASRIDEYQVNISDDGYNWTLAGKVSSAFHTFRIAGNILPGIEYFIQVKPVTNFGVTNHIEKNETYREANSLTLANDTTAPGDCSGLATTPGVLEVKLTWTNPSDYDLAGVEIWAATSNDRAGASKIATTRGESWYHSGIAMSQTYYYWLKPVDTSRNEGNWFPVGSTSGVSGTPTTDSSQLVILLADSITAATIVAGTITGTEIAGDSIASAHIVAGTIEASDIKADTITANEIAATTITAAEIAATTITGAKIAVTTIEAGNIVSGTITATQIASDTIESANIKAGTIVAGDIAAVTITAENLVLRTITYEQIKLSTITTAEIAANTITANNIKAGEITVTEVAADVIALGGTANWSEVVDDDANKPANNAEINTINALDGLNALEAGTGDKLSGIATGADVTSAQFSNSLSTIDTQVNRAEVGFDSSSNLITKVLPGSAVGTPGGAGLFLGSDYMGYYSGSAWTAYIDNTGDFKFGDADNYVAWDGSDLTIVTNATNGITVGGGADIYLTYDDPDFGVINFADVGFMGPYDSVWGGDGISIYPSGTDSLLAIGYDPADAENTDPWRDIYVEATDAIWLRTSESLSAGDSTNSVLLISEEDDERIEIKAQWDDDTSGLYDYGFVRIKPHLQEARIYGIQEGGSASYILLDWGDSEITLNADTTTFTGDAVFDGTVQIGKLHKNK